jgi:hypothetical protein
MLATIIPTSHSLHAISPAPLKNTMSDAGHVATLPLGNLTNG